MKKIAILLCASLLASTCYAMNDFYQENQPDSKKKENDNVTKLHQQAFAHIHALQAKLIEQQLHAGKSIFPDIDKAYNIAMILRAGTELKRAVDFIGMSITNGRIQKNAKESLAAYNRIQSNKLSLCQLDQQMIDSLFISKDTSS